MAIADQQRKALQDEAYRAGAADFAGTSLPYIAWLEEQLVVARARAAALEAAVDEMVAGTDQDADEK